MMKSKVSCWFCNKESLVFIIYKNSWTCESCNQYNGFKKDGDYNKQIPEMQKVNKQKFCVNNSSISPKKSESTNLLCNRCNSSQEQKLKDLSKFEAKNEDNFDEEYKIYKLKLDQIHDLCRMCKMKLNQHLQRQDLQIGHYLSTEKAHSAPLKKQIARGNNEIKKRVTLGKVADENVPPPEATKTYKKAYTVSGSSPYNQERRGHNYTVSGSSPYSQERRNLGKRHDYEHNPKKYIYEPEEVYADTLKSKEDYTTKVDNLLSSNLVKSKDTISWFIIQTVFVDFVSFLGIIIIFLCDLVNLINDSGIWENNDYDSGDFSNGSDQTYLFKAFLKVYKYTQLLLTTILIVSVYIAVKRPKMSRFLTILGILFNILIHMNFFGTQSDEKYIMEVFVSFFLGSYLSLARAYNVVQFYRYVKTDA